MSLHAFNCKILLSILSNFKNFKRTHRMDLFVEVTNLTKGNTISVHYTSTGYYPTLIRLSQQIPKENVRITPSWCCFKMMHIDWDNTMVTGISA